MLSVFPSFLSWSQVSPLIIRLTLGVVFIFWSYRAFLQKSLPISQKIITIIEVIAGILLVIGLWTQVAALVIAIDLIVRLYQKATQRAFLSDGVNYYLILLVMAVSLLFTGAGFWSFDLPL